MRRELRETSVVLVAQHFNPALVNQLWLVRHGVLTEEEFESGCVFTDALVQVRARRAILLFTPAHLQMVLRVPEEEQAALVAEMVPALVRAVQPTPLRALGLNFTWSLVPEDGNIHALARRSFFVDRPLFSDFDVPDATFGAYLSRELFGFRLHLEAKPTSSGAGPGPRLQLLFNYHADLRPETSVASIQRLLSRWSEAANTARRLAETIPDGGQP